MSKGWFHRRNDGDDYRDERRDQQCDSDQRDRELRRRSDQDQTYQERIEREIEYDDYHTPDPDYY